MTDVVATRELTSLNPATGEPIGAVPTVAPDEVARIAEEVAQVQPFWAQLSVADRGRYLRRAAQVIIDESAEIRDLLAREQGKPRVEAYAMEILPTVDACHWLASTGVRLLAEERVPSHQWFLKTKRMHHAFEPLGVVGVIAPWNYPWSIPFGEVAAALLAGNGVVLKPASLTPLLGERIRDVLERAGVPEGLVRVVHGGGAVGRAVVEADAVRKVFFTGSVDVGRGVAEGCAARLKGCVLELGGKDAAIVLDDCDLEHTVAGIAWGAFANAGQTCSGIERVYVQRGVAERFTRELVARAAALRVGDPLRWDTEVGPMTSAEQRDVVDAHVREAVAAGATLHCGGPASPPGLEGAFYAPAVLTDVPPDARILREETFGPAVPVVVVEDEEEAVGLANDSPFGLGASVWTCDRAKGERMAAALETGMVWLNDHMFSHGAFQTAWGGRRDSGLGRAHGRFGLLECVEVKTRVWEPAHARNLWWHPYDQSLGRALETAARVLYGRESERLGALRGGLRPLGRVARRTLGRGT